MKTSSSLSRREKLLLGLLSSTLIFSASFSYGAVNSNKVDSIMKMITDGGAKFSDIPVAGQSKSERTQYFEKVDAGLGDAVEMLATVRNNIRALMGLSPAYTADDVVGGILGGILGGVGTGTINNTTGNSGGIIGRGVFIYRVKPLASQSEADKARADLGALQCISSIEELRRINPDTIGPNNPNGYDYSTYKGLGKDCYFNVKNHAQVIAWSKNPEVKNRPANIPDSCRVGTKFVANAERGIVLAECVTREYAYGIGKPNPSCTDDPKAVVFDLNKMRGNSTFHITETTDISGKPIMYFDEGSYAKGHYGIIEFTKDPGETKTSEIISIRIDLRDGRFDPSILPKKITDVPSQYQNDEYPTWGASWYINDSMLWQRYDQVSTELASLSQCAGDFTSSEVRLIGGYRSDTPIVSFSQLVMGQLDHPSRKLQLLEGSEKIMNGAKNIFLQPGSVWYLNYRVQYGMNRSSPYAIPLKADGTPYPSNKTTWPFGSAPINKEFGYKPCSVQKDGTQTPLIRAGCVGNIPSDTFKSFFSNVPEGAEFIWSTTSH